MLRAAYFPKTKLLLTLMMAIFFSSCATKELRVHEYQLSTDAANPAKPREEFYLVGPGDALAIHFWNEALLSGPVKVRPDGYITLPLINEVQVAGLTTAQLRKMLEEKYTEFVVKPSRTIRVEGIVSTEVFLIGQVTRPAAYTLSGSDTLLQLLTRAGGLTIFADRGNVRVVRREGEKVTEFTVDYDAILKGDLKQDILLKPGDRIIVP